MTYDPKDFERDEPLGRALRQSLEPSEDAGVFAARVMARVESPRMRTWDLLAGWSRWGLVAAAAAAVAAAMLIPRPADDVSVRETLANTRHVEANEMMSEADSPGVDVLFASTDPR